MMEALRLSGPKRDRPILRYTQVVLALTLDRLNTFQACQMWGFPRVFRQN